MRVEKGLMVPLGYGKFFRSDRIAGLEPIEEGRGPGRRTRVFVDDVEEPLIASRSETAILRDLVEKPARSGRNREQAQLLLDILESIRQFNPTLRSIIRDQGKLDIDRLQERIQDMVGNE